MSNYTNIFPGYVVFLKRIMDHLVHNILGCKKFPIWMSWKGIPNLERKAK